MPHGTNGRSAPRVITLRISTSMLLLYGSPWPWRQKLGYGAGLGQAKMPAAKLLQRFFMRSFTVQSMTRYGPVSTDGTLGCILTATFRGVDHDASRLLDQRGSTDVGIRHRLLLPVLIILALGCTKQGVRDRVICPVCRDADAIITRANISTATQSRASRNLALDDSVHATIYLFPPEGLVCSRCWYAKSILGDIWAMYSTNIHSIAIAPSNEVFAFPLPEMGLLVESPKYGQTIYTNRIKSEVSFWCVEDSQYEMEATAFAKSNRLSIVLSRGRIPNRIHVSVASDPDMGRNTVSVRPSTP